MDEGVITNEKVAELLAKEKEIRSICLNCGKSFSPKRSDGKFDTDKCRYEYWHRNYPRVDLTKLTRDTIDRIAAEGGWHEGKKKSKS